MQVFFVVYDIVFFIGFLIYLPIYILKKKINLAALKEKIGFIKVKEKNYIWIHAVSVGEVILIQPLIKRLNETFSYPILVTTTTLAGNKLAKQKFLTFAEVIFFPYDISFVIFRVLKIIRPKVFITVETELWPNLFYNLKRKKIPIIIINARISKKAFKRYKVFKPFIANTLKKCDYIGVQNQAYKEKFINLGYFEKKLIITGNLKFESVVVDNEKLTKFKQLYLPSIKVNKNKLLIIAASTHHPEERIIFDIYKDILNEFANINLLIAPRHIERVSQIETFILSSKFYPLRISKIKDFNFEQNNIIYILDVIGELLYFYSIADICFIGGSLIKFGGHNILEPIYFGKPTIFGPFMDNFKDIVDIVLEKEAGIMVKNEVELKDVLLQLIKNENLRLNFKNKCFEVFEKQKGTLEKNLKIISNCIK
ncbi:MAG: 3-deoxy-D-manno-octulosonic acid transferase [Candidatus Omnitrophica bacterium]|nr:3-deoxy-D-manno-octulosonic acid transferase [Candidatus Omnitrophota bacterium]